MSRIRVRPSRASYSVARGAETLAVKLDGGASRFRRDILSAAFLVDVEWQLDVSGYNYINAFYRTTIVHGSLPFTINLILDQAALVEYTAKIIPGTFRLTRQEGLLYVVSAQLEVTAADPSGDATVVSNYEAANPTT